MAVDLIRSPYKTRMRFFRDREDLTDVWWFLCPAGTPFVESSGPFCSANWDSDPKPVNTSLGEDYPNVIAYNAEGTGPAFPRAHAAGPREWWLGGEPSPPDPATPLNGEGVPLSCFVGVAPSPVPQLPAPLIHVRPEEMAGVFLGGPAPFWPGALTGGLGFFTGGPDAPIWEATPGGPGALLTNALPLTVRRTYTPQEIVRVTGDWTVFLVGGNISVGSPGGPAWGVSNPVLSVSGRPAVRADRIIVSTGLTTFAEWLSPLVENEVNLYSVRCAGGILRIRWNGVAVTGGSYGVGLTTAWNLSCWASGAGHGVIAFVNEALLLPYATTPEQDAEWLTYFRDRYPIPLTE